MAKRLLILLTGAGLFCGCGSNPAADTDTPQPGSAAAARPSTEPTAAKSSKGEAESAGSSSPFVLPADGQVTAPTKIGTDFELPPAPSIPKVADTPTLIPRSKTLELPKLSTTKDEKSETDAAKKEGAEDGAPTPADPKPDSTDPPK